MQLLAELLVGQLGHILIVALSSWRADLRQTHHND